MNDAGSAPDSGAVAELRQLIERIEEEKATFHKNIKDVFANDRNLKPPLKL
ncbi:MAG TPA: GapR family DNA-binding domain-containing protein [Rhizobiaceae bacterium]|nr:GapR family DNA-binding domain-containing protein [Rhizobiaceae bacterium]